MGKKEGVYVLYKSAVRGARPRKKGDRSSLTGKLGAKRLVKRSDNLTMLLKMAASIANIGERGPAWVSVERVGDTGACIVFFGSAWTKPLVRDSQLSSGETALLAGLGMR